MTVSTTSRSPEPLVSYWQTAYWPRRPSRRVAVYAALRYLQAGGQTYASSESQPRQLQALVRQPPPSRRSEAPLLRRNQIKLAERLLIKQCPFLAISAAPVFVTTRNPDEIARPDTFGTCIVPVQIGATQDDNQHIGRVRVHPCIESRTALRKPPNGPLGVSPQGNE